MRPYMKIVGKSHMVTDHEAFYQAIDTLPRTTTYEEIVESIGMPHKSIAYQLKVHHSTSLTKMGFTREYNITRDMNLEAFYAELEEVCPVTLQQLSDLVFKHGAKKRPVHSSIVARLKYYGHDMSKYIHPKLKAQSTLTIEELLEYLRTAPKVTTIKTVAKHFNESRFVISRLLASAGTGMRELGFVYFDTDNHPSIEEFTQTLAESPHTIYSLAKHYNVPDREIRRWLKKWGVRFVELNMPYAPYPGIYAHKGIVLGAHNRMKVVKCDLLISDIGYSHSNVLVDQGLESQIYLIDADGNESIQTPIEIIDEYINKQKI